ncbi:unnamed protein product, partial [Prunus brigantina]
TVQLQVRNRGKNYVWLDPLERVRRQPTVIRCNHESNSLSCAFVFRAFWSFTTHVYQVSVLNRFRPRFQSGNWVRSSHSMCRKYDTVGILGLLQEQKRTAALRMLAYGASAERGVRIPMNTALTRIYERPMGPNGQPMEHEPLIQNGQYNNPMIYRYQEMQSSYVHERRQVDLIEHLWEMKGNHSG